MSEISFERAVAALASDLVAHGNKVFEDTHDETTLGEAYRMALRRGGLEILGGLADSAIRAYEEKKVSGELIFELFADAVDMATINECRDIVWKELEERASYWRPLTLSTQQRPKLAMLKVANELLRRISSSQQPILSGRVLTLLAAALPLSDSSGFNSAGKYNFENETPFESFAEYTENGGNSKDYQAYERFWKLQKHFSGPFVYAYLNDLKMCLESTFQIFETKPLVTNVSRETEGERETPKYLTAGRLLPLQWSDPKFRRFILVQVLYFVRQVALYGETVNNTDLVNTAMLWRARAIKLLDQIPPKRQVFTNAVLACVDRELVWESWKKDKCPEIEQALPPVRQIDITTAFTKKSSIEMKKPKWMTSSSQSWEASLMKGDSGGDDDDDDENERDALELLSYRMLDALQPGYDRELYDPTKDFIYCWQGMRLTRQRRLDLFNKYRTFEGVTRSIHSLEPLPEDETEEELLASLEEASRPASAETSSVEQLSANESTQALDSRPPSAMVSEDMSRPSSAAQSVDALSEQNFDGRPTSPSKMSEIEKYLVSNSDIRDERVVEDSAKSSEDDRQDFQRASSTDVVQDDSAEHFPSTSSSSVLLDSETIMAMSSGPTVDSSANHQFNYVEDDDIVVEGGESRSAKRLKRTASGETTEADRAADSNGS